MYALIAAVAFLASGLTLFSGFGLGTLLTPAFALFFPAELAVGMTAVVHLANNLFKLALLGRAAERSTVLRFGLPAAAAAFLGAKTLVWLADLPPLLIYHQVGRDFQVTPVKAVIAGLLLVFAGLELSPRASDLRIPSRFLPLGGLLSGFFGGLSGNQGALRSAFLLKAGLSKDQFIATGVVIACMIDATRLSVYTRHFYRAGLAANGGLLALACLSAFAGAFLGARLVGKVTMRTVQCVVAVMLALIAIGLGTGLL